MRTERQRLGFSLVELLVVIAIIALLAALLFPVFVRGSEGGSRTRCMSNMRQLTTAFTMYVQDHDGYLPPQAPLPPEGTNSTCWDLQLRPYIRNREVIACPADTLSRRLDIPKVGRKMMRSYKMTANTSGVATGQLPLPAETVLLLESSTVGTQEAPRASVWSYEAIATRLGKLTLEPIGLTAYVPPDFRHNEMGDYAYADGHVKALKGPNPHFAGYRTDSDAVALCGFADPLPR